MPLIALALIAWLGSMFVYSGGVKLARYDQARGAVASYNILPVPIASAAGFLLPWAELFAGISLLLGFLFPLGPLFGVTLGTAFSYASFQVLRRGADVPCGCSGKSEERVNRKTLVRALVITLSSFVILWVSQFEPIQIPLPVSALLIVLSLLPAGLIIYRQFRETEAHREKAATVHQELLRMKQALAAPPSPPMPAHLIHRMNNVTPSNQEESVALRQTT